MSRNNFSFSHLGKICGVLPSPVLCVVDMDDMGRLLTRNWLRLQWLGLHSQMLLFVRIPETCRELFPPWQALPRRPRRRRRWPRRRRRLGCCGRGRGQPVDKFWLEDGLVDAGEGGLEGEVEAQTGRH